MNALVLCCGDRKIEDNLPIAQALGLGLEMQGLMYAEALEHPDAAIAYRERLLCEHRCLRALHGPFVDLCPGSADPLIREVSMRRVRQVLPIAAVLRATHLIFHHGLVPGSLSFYGWLERAVAFWREALSALPGGITLHLENYVEHDPAQMRDVVDALADARVNINLDLGHCHAMSRVSPLDWVRALGARIGYVHLHDNDGMADQHRPLGTGTLPLRATLDALEELAPQAIWAIETDAAPSLAWLERAGYCS
jgi:sugar phosphate isomerase/epimerase